MKEITNSSIKAILRPYYQSVRYGVPKGYIFMLHRVEKRDPDKLFANENMKVSPEFLDDFLTEYRDKCDFISLQEVPERLKSRSKRKFMVFTMDDGYRDNFTKALPVFIKNQTPFTIFLATDFADRKVILWWYVLEDIILKSDRIVLSGNRIFDCKTRRQKEDAFLQIRDIILKLNQNDLVHELNELFESEIDWMGKTNDLAASWDDINHSKKEPLLTIGGHTRSHCNLKILEKKADVYREIADGIDILRENTGINAKVFAYPYGSHTEVGKREIETAAESGLDMACLAYGGYCAERHRNSVFALPRIMLTEDFDEKLLL